jgi:hypothetical protein
MSLDGTRMDSSNDRSGMYGLVWLLLLLCSCPRLCFSVVRWRAVDRTIPSTVFCSDRNFLPKQSFLSFFSPFFNNVCCFPSPYSGSTDAAGSGCCRKANARSKVQTELKPRSRSDSPESATKERANVRGAVCITAAYILRRTPRLCTIPLYTTSLPLDNPINHAATPLRPPVPSSKTSASRFSRVD